METKKVLGIIFSILFIGAFAFVLSWGIINFNKVKDGMSGTGVYTKDDVDNAYEDGYNTALMDKDEYDELIDGYRDIITSQTDQISSLNSKVTMLTNNNKDYTNQITNLENQKANLQEQVTNLTTIKESNENTISSLNAQITSLQNEVSDLENSNENKDKDITQKNSQISSLQATVTQLQRTNELNLDTITNLNNQITSLNSQISDMTLQIQNNSTNVTSLNNKIAELEKSVSYYEQYIANLENGEQVVVTFEFDGSVYNIQIINKNDTVSVVNPTSTDNIIFNYWTVNDKQIDLSTYQFTTNTKVVANVTYKYDVKFMVDTNEYNSQIVTKDGYATLPDNPTKDGYEFDGWTINGVDLVSDITTKPVTQNITYVAKFTKLHTVTFMYEDTIKDTQIIRNGEYPTNITIDSTTYKVFNGWKLNDVIVDVSTQKIYADTTLVADITYKYDVKFMVDDEIYNSQIVVKDGYANLPDNPINEKYEFNGWSIDGVDIISNIEAIPVTQNTIYIALITKLWTVRFINNGNVLSTQIVKNNEYAEYVSIESTDKKEFVGWTVDSDVINVPSYKIIEDTDFIASIINIYEVQFKLGSYIINTQKVKEFGFPILPNLASYSEFVISGWRIFDVYGNFKEYYQNPEAYIVHTDIIIEADYDFSISGLKSSGVTNNYISTIVPSYIWYWKDVTYYSDYNGHYYFDKNTRTWKEKVWNGCTDFVGVSIWNDGNRVYVSNVTYQYVLDESTDTWVVNDWIYKGNAMSGVCNGKYYIGSNYLFNVSENRFYNISAFYNKDNGVKISNVYFNKNLTDSFADYFTGYEDSQSKIYYLIYSEIKFSGDNVVLYGFPKTITNNTSKNIDLPYEFLSLFNIGNNVCLQMSDTIYKVSQVADEDRLIISSYYSIDSYLFSYVWTDGLYYYLGNDYVFI